jgi:ABC-type dipeptide/oligopeptide/nickel transport system ATPase component
VLDFRDVTISYGSASGEDAAVFNLNMCLEPGTVLGVAGESGSGKSTIAKALLDILPPYASVTGEILFDGRDILKMPRHERDALRGSEISMIFQDPATALNPIRKVRRQFYDILRDSVKGKAALDRRIEKELSAVHLPEPRRVMEQYPPQLSGGMKQRVVIAAAMCNRPRLLIADEPTSALDASVRPRIIDEIARIKHEHNLTMLYISHNLAELERICDSIMVMKDGRVLEHGSTEQILSKPKDEYTRLLIDAAFGGNING